MALKHTDGHTYTHTHTYGHKHKRRRDQKYMDINAIKNTYFPIDFDEIVSLYSLSEPIISLK